MPSPLDETPRPGRRLGRYTLHHRIARGGMGSVFLATVEGPAGFERWFAVKLMHPHLSEASNLVKRFHDEARVASRIQHPNVCSVIDFGEDEEGLLYLVMEYLHGEPLVELARQDDPVPAWLALRVIADAARGLHAAHELTDERGAPLGLVHRDVSPQNLVVLYDGPTKVLDFGVVRVRDQIATTNEGSMRGKLGYMSPEQIETQPLDRRSDVFSLGVVLWELLSGQRLFKRDSAVDTMKAVLFDAPPPPSSLRADLDARVDDLVARCLRHERELRYATAAELADAIEETLNALGERSDHARVATEVTRRLEGQRSEKEALLTAVEAGEPVTTPYRREEPSLSHVRDRSAARPAWILPVVAVSFLALGVGGTVIATQLASGPRLEPEVTTGEPAGGIAPAAEPEPELQREPLAAPEPEPEPAPAPEAEPEPEREAPAARRPPAELGQLNLIALPEADVYLGTRRLGRTPLVGVALPEGRHRLSLRATDGRRETLVVRVHGGRTTALSHRFEVR